MRSLVSLVGSVIAVASFAGLALGSQRPAKKAYLVGQIAVTDPTRYETYRVQVTPIVEKFGGRYLARGGRLLALLGEPGPGRLVIVEFPSMEHAENFYKSEEYAPMRRLRESASTGRLVLVEGE